MKPALSICTDHFFQVDKSKEDPNGKSLTWFVLHEAPRSMAIPPPPLLRMGIHLQPWVEVGQRFLSNRYKLLDEKA